MISQITNYSRVALQIHRHFFGLISVALQFCEDVRAFGIEKVLTFVNRTGGITSNQTNLQTSSNIQPQPRTHLQPPRPQTSHLAPSNICPTIELIVIFADQRSAEPPIQSSHHLTRIKSSTIMSLRENRHVASLAVILTIISFIATNASANKLLHLLTNSRPIMPITHTRHRIRYQTRPLSQLKYGQASKFTFDRFHSASSIDNALSTVRSQSSFKHYCGRDGREGYYASTPLGDDWVLAESRQIAYKCTPKDVLAAYLDGENQKKWNTDKVRDIKITKMRSRGGGWFRQDMVLKPQRVLSGSTGEMRYTQVIRVDKIGNGDYNAFVELLDSEKEDTKSTILRPFNILKVNVNLRQDGPNVEITAAGLMKVNRGVVPNLVIFDAAGIAGSMAGKGTLWLSSHFRKDR
jgi:hypothetical protein